MVVDYLRDYEMRAGRKLETMSLDTREGANKAKLYGITNYPAILALSDDGRLLKLWQEGHMPLMDEVAYYDRHSPDENTGLIT